MVHKQHSKDAKSTTFGKPCAGQKSIREGITDLEVSAHARQRTSPSSGNLMGGSGKDSKAKRWVTGNTIEALLQVSRHPAQRCVGSIGLFDLLQKEVPKV